MLYIPCLGCDAKGHYVNSLGTDVETCFQCCGEGRIEVSQAEYNEFWRHFSLDDFK